MFDIVVQMKENSPKVHMLVLCDDSRRPFKSSLLVWSGISQIQLSVFFEAKCSWISSHPLFPPFLLPRLTP
jgi:hypothetical protein